MGARRFNPRIELEGALCRGELEHAITLAAEVGEAAGGRPLDLATALRFLPLVAASAPAHYDAWALRWLARWAREAAASIELAAIVAAQLADLPAEPSLLAAVERHL